MNLPLDYFVALATALALALPAAIATHVTMFLQLVFLHTGERMLSVSIWSTGI